MIVMGMNITGIWGSPRWIEEHNLPVLRAARRVAASRSLLRFTLLGLVLGLLPCGLSYTIFVAAAGSGGLLQGWSMAFFSASGTLPALLAFGALVSILSSQGPRQDLPRGRTPGDLHGCLFRLERICNSMPVCDHCLLEVSEREAVVDEINGQRKVFCCHACNGIYRLIRNEGLEEFYARRKEWTPGPCRGPAGGPIRLHRQSAAGGKRDRNGYRDRRHPLRILRLAEREDPAAHKGHHLRHGELCHAPGEDTLGSRCRSICLQCSRRIRSIGYTPKPFLPRAWEDEQKRQSRDLLVRFGTAAFFSMQLMLFSMALYAGYFQGMDETDQARLSPDLLRAHHAGTVLFRVAHHARFVPRPSEPHVHHGCPDRGRRPVRLRIQHLCPDDRQRGLFRYGSDDRNAHPARPLYRGRSQRPGVGDHHAGSCS